MNWAIHSFQFGSGQPSIRSRPAAVDSRTHKPQAAVYENVMNETQMIGNAKKAAAMPDDIPENDAVSPFKTTPMIMIKVNPSDRYTQRTIASLRQGSRNTPEKKVQFGGAGAASWRISASRSKTPPGRNLGP